uniref:Uncharacterized protein n=1 Tax=Cannabis sativa TaxID=3483 RepID=A0A803PAQ7_CANSA
MLPLLVAGHLQVINGGPHITGHSNKALDRYTWTLRYEQGNEVLAVEEINPKQPKVEELAITFTYEGVALVRFPHNDPLFITTQIGNMTIARCMVDYGASSNIIFKTVQGEDQSISDFSRPKYIQTSIQYNKNRGYWIKSKHQARALKDEIEKLCANNFIIEAFYHIWVSNPVLLPKPHNKWGVYINFINLNKACPKDYLLLPRINQLVDTTAGHEILSLMDAYSGYNQIKMYLPDQEHTSFLTGVGLYCYKILKEENATADALARLASSTAANKTNMVPIQYLQDPSIAIPEKLDMLDDSPTWMTPIAAYI